MNPKLKLWICTTVIIAGSAAASLAFGPHASALDKDTKPAAYSPRLKGSVTFTKDIAPIMFSQCTSCHRHGEISPFDLETYQDAKKRAKQLALVCESRYMPPWHADSHGEFVDERRLTSEQIGLIKQWAADGAPQGDPKATPPTPTFPQGWALGTPDLVLQPSAVYHLAAEGG